MKRTGFLALAVCAIGAFLVRGDVSPAERERNRRLAWWREARFGMFIHWGVYSVPAGEWKGKPVAGLGEWIMNRGKIPVVEYEKLAAQFNPVKFNADEWVSVAKNAGAKYLVITAKHHDGFAMFGSKASKYNVVDATPFHRDPMKELSAACQRAGIRFCFYYSQTQDWYEPDAVGNDWDFPDDGKKNFNRYFEEKVKPQVRELLTNYGPIGLIWFDTPRNISREQSEELTKFVHQLQPDCLVSGRVGNGAGDYNSAGDNQISVGKVNREWESPVTMNDTWGFKKDDQNWKSPTILIRQMARIASRSGNYLLNVGPTSEGVIPQPSVERLAAVGRWMKTNGESIYGSSASPFPYELPWGVITTGDNKLYLHVFHWPAKEFVLYGLKNKVTRVSLLGDPTRKGLSVKQNQDDKSGHYELRVAIPAAAPDPADSVLVVETSGPVDAITRILQQPDRSVTLPAFLGDMHHSAPEAKMKLDSRGVIEKWLDKDEWLDWSFQVSDPGRFDVELITSQQKYGKDWEGGHRVTVSLAGSHLAGAVSDDGKLENSDNPYWPYVVSKIGTAEITKAGTYTLQLKPATIETQKNFGLTLVSVKLSPK